MRYVRAMISVPAWGTPAPTRPLAPMTVQRREPRARDVVIDILFCGVCHSDLHQARGEWGGERYPMVPGHEIVGRVSRVGAEVTRFEPGDQVGVGCLVDACGTCGSCREGMEQFCDLGAAVTYNGTEMDRETPTYGGYSTQIVVDERFVLRVPDSLDPAAAAPLLCAGVTTWSPLRQWNCKPGDRVGVVGLGGLGHVAVKLAKSLGAHVTVLSTSAGKEADARRLGADAFAVTQGDGALKHLGRTMDLILDTVSAPHEYAPYLSLLRPRGTLVLVGAPTEPASVHAFSLIVGNKRLVGSMIGGIAETQEMLDHCTRHGITADVECISIQDINHAWERMLRSDVRYRFVIDLQSLRSAQP
ncbi:MAG: hypothetical protein RL653_1435 [Pseudomonadota bacterium]